MSFEVEDFQKEVLQASNSVPVVVDFWAEWCGPCRQLGPVIEKLANEADGAWKLVKVDTDRHQDIAIQFNVRGIPSVKMIYQGDVIAEFTGAQPETRIRKWLEENLPEGVAGSDEWKNEVKAALGEGNRQTALQKVEQVAEDGEGSQSDDLKVKLALLLLPRHLNRAEELLEKVENKLEYDIEFEAFETIKHLKALKKDKAEWPENGGKVRELYEQGIEALFNEEFENGIENFIEILSIDREFDDDGARKACVSIFTILSEEHPLTIKFRRRFSMMLY